MTVQMGIALAIVILMIVMIMSDKFSFGAPPLIACCLLVLTGISTIEDAFAGFVDKNVIMVAGFMAVMAAVQKTSLMDGIKNVLAKLATKGGFKAYALILIVIMLGTSLVGGGNTGYYVMILTILSTIPYSKQLPNSKLLMPGGFATGRALIPVSVAFFMGLASSLLDGTGHEADITLARYAGMSFFMSLFFLIWCLIAYKLLPDHDVEGKSSAQKEETPSAAAMPKWKEYCTYVAFASSIVGMIFASSIGEIAYILPCVMAGFLCLIGVYDFKELRANVFSPLILMMAAVIGVANALASTGFTAMIGEAVAGLMGGSVNYFVLVLVFCLLTSACSTLTGAAIGSLFVFAPIAIATCTSLGINPAGVAAAMTAAAWGGGFLPIDGLPAMVLGMGKYKLSDFFKFTIPMYLIQILGLVVGAVIMFPA
ncbi:SLC13 family permease [Faecalibacterium prausnitzii]|uniref:SLC13 family permease n=1 Tax=Faecalibacterium prausnitzii TaxID=853 RepID=UPI0022DEEDBF|nr:SLC13 family permease [Faecalibacterium prausnitzii]